MSRAFVSDDALENSVAVVPPRAPLPDGVANYVTPRGLARLRDEQAALEAERAAVEANRRGADADRTRRLSALNQQLSDLTARLRTARLVRPQPAMQEARFGAAVAVAHAGGEVRTYQIVGVDEADAAEGRIAFTSPLARALTGKRAGDAWMLPPPPSRVVIGREAGCAVLLDDRDCSRQHAEVLRDAESVIVRDLGSKNGFVVAGRTLTEKRLRHGDELTIGATTLRYHDPTEELLRSFETGVDELAPPSPDPVPVAAISSPPEAPTASAPVAAEVSQAPEGAAPEADVSVEARAAARVARAQFDWLVVLLAVVILVVSVSALVLLLFGGRGRL
jgi:transcription elongation factor GreB